LSDLEVEEALERSPTTREKDMLEVLATREALAFADRIARRRGVDVDERLIREIHRRVLDDIDPMLRPGEYRRGENRVADAEGKLIFSTPQSGDVPDLMHRFGSWLRNAPGHPAPIVAALAHLELVAIHPFYDGNGRTARALARLLLIRGGYALNGIVSLDAYLDLQRRAYFAAIRRSLGRTYKRGYDGTPFVAYFITAIAAAAEHVLSQVKTLGTVVNDLRANAVRGVLPARLIDGLGYAWVNGSIRPADYVRLTGREPAGASRDLQLATRLGYLEATGQSRARRYLLGPKLRQIPHGRLTRFRVRPT
jgi:Fic family protein